MRFLDIFCDASTIIYSGITYACSGFIAIDREYPDEIKTFNQKVLSFTTNNESEIYAIYMATQYYIRMRKEYDKISIFSDSLMSVKGLKEWFFDWVKHQSNGILMSNNGPVANQQLFLKTIYTVIDSDLFDYGLWHVCGHKHFKSKYDKSQAYKTFKKVNGIEVNDDFLTYLIINNNKIDMMSRDILKDIRKYHSVYNKPPKPDFLYEIPTSDQVRRYYKMIKCVNHPCN